MLKKDVVIMFEQMVLLVVLFFQILILIKLVLTSKRSDDKLMDRVVEQLEKSYEKQDVKLSMLNEQTVRLERERSQSLYEFQGKIDEKLMALFRQQEESIERKLLLIDHKVNESLEQGFEKTNQTFTNIVSRLTKIDEAQKKIDTLSNEIVSLQDVLTDKKTRGVFGEVQLNQILTSVFGEKNDAVYQLQHQFKTGTRSDAVLFAPDPLGTVAIDSKFPLENYRKMTDTSLEAGLREGYSKAFTNDCIKHIDDIANRYIIPNETGHQAFMFVPAEAVFATINAYYPKIIEYSHHKNVWIVSPTTLMSTLTTVQAILINMQRDKYAQQIHEHLNLLAIEFDRYKVRWDKLSRNIDSVSTSVKDIHITTDKISKKFDDISLADSGLIDQD
ncbi:DNA recombination protein RmuC [Erysipelothrix urinaevulpis]